MRVCGRMPRGDRQAFCGRMPARQGRGPREATMGVARPDTHHCLLLVDVVAEVCQVEHPEAEARVGPEVVQAVPAALLQAEGILRSSRGQSCRASGQRGRRRTQHSGNAHPIDAFAEVVHE